MVFNYHRLLNPYKNGDITNLTSYFKIAHNYNYVTNTAQYIENILCEPCNINTNLEIGMI